MNSSNLIEKLEAVVGEEFIHTAPEALRTYACDALTIYKGQPGAVVIPGSTEEIRQIARICHEAKVPLIARGAGTCLSGGSTPAPGGVLLVTSRMNRILEVDYENMIARVSWMDSGAISSTSPSKLTGQPSPRTVSRLRPSMYSFVGRVMVAKSGRI